MIWEIESIHPEEMDMIFGNTISAVRLDICTNWLVKASRLMKGYWIRMIANASLREEFMFLALKTALLWPFKKTLLDGFQMARRTITQS